MSIGWDSPETAELYEQFCNAHGRYRDANAALVAHAGLAGDLLVLDVAAGTGRTAEAALPLLGDGAHVVCFEPAAAMRSVGKRRVPDGRISWTAELPDGRPFDRVLCGAAIWLLDPLEEAIGRLAGLVAPEGALCFTIPALYLGEPDEPGGGRDPLLLELPARVANGRLSDAPPGGLPATAGRIDESLTGAGLRPVAWELERRVTQDELRDWLKIPVLTDHLLPEHAGAERERLIDAAYRQVDRGSWRRERWRGWTAWR